MSRCTLASAGCVLVLTSALAVTGAGVSSADDVDTNHRPTFKLESMRGSGCSEDDTEFKSRGRYFVAAFDDFTAETSRDTRDAREDSDEESDSNVDAHGARKICRMTIGIRAPKGFSLAVRGVKARGTYELSRKSYGAAMLRWSTGGNKHGARTLFTEAKDPERFTLIAAGEGRDLAWSECGGHTTLRVVAGAFVGRHRGDGAKVSFSHVAGGVKKAEQDDIAVDLKPC